MRPQAQLNGFKSRALKPKAPREARHLYATEWRRVPTTQADDLAVSRALVFADAELDLGECTRLRSAASHDEMVAQLLAGSWTAVAMAVALQRGQVDRAALVALEVAFKLVQTQMANAPTSDVWLLTSSMPLGSQTSRIVQHAGVWGLARSARAESQLPIACLDGSAVEAFQYGAVLRSLLEPEAALRVEGCLVPRLVYAPRRSDAPGTSTVCVRSSHVVTGGTSGLGLLTGRWIGGRGARTLALASRSGAVTALTAEWEQMSANAASVLVTRCDTAEAVHIQRLLSHMNSPVDGVWHAAGVLADGLLGSQSASSLASVRSRRLVA